jgi:DNA-binding beta-propeller fold protein YncE
VSTVRGVGHCDGGFAVTPDGRTIYVAEYQTNSIVRIALTGSDPTRPEHWSASVIAGANVGEGYANGNGSVARFTTPEGLAIDAVGNLYCSERGNRLRRLVWTGGDPSIATNWHVTSIAGSEFGTAGDTDGQGWWAHFRNPQGLACDLAGNIYLADSGNHRIRKVTPAGNVTTFAGSTAGYQDGVGSGAQFNNPVDVSVDAAGYVYVVDFGNRRIRCISPSGKVTTVAGTGTNGTLDGPGNVAQFNYPYACEATPSGALYVVANGESTIRLIQRIISAP